MQRQPSRVPSAASPSGVPPVPSKLVDVEVVSRSRRGAARVVLVAPDEPADGPDAGAPDNGKTVRQLDGTDLPEEWLPAGDLSGKAGEVHGLAAGHGVPRWLLGVGAETDDPAGWRTAGAALVRAVNADLAAADGNGRKPSRTVQVTVPDGVEAACVEAFALGARLGGYRFVVSESDPDPTVRTLVVVTSSGTEAERAQAVRDAGIQSAATALARDLANMPSNVKNPGWLARTAERVAGRTAGLRVEIRDEKWLADKGFGGVLAVGGGSASEPCLIEMTYRPRGARHHLMLVGKGITFDTGGVSLKPAEGMHLMRTDMSGGAAVIGAMRAIAERKLPVKITALVPAAENHVSGSAYRPGDVITHYGGRTSEIGNTDAEGRIVLADALAYGIKRFSPEAVVDVATLTGAMKVALGLRTGALFASDDELAARLREAGERVGETLWRMPLLDEHAEAVRGELADVRQTPAGPGGITAALFLREFTSGLPWAHLDIAGPARADRTYDEVTPGGTGFAARTLVEFAASYA